MKHAVRNVLKYLPLRARDAFFNRRCNGKRFLIVRHAGRAPRFYDLLFKWTARNAPAI